jgi:hypothetical protein
MVGPFLYVVSESDLAAYCDGLSLVGNLGVNGLDDIRLHA